MRYNSQSLPILRFSLPFTVKAACLAMAYFESSHHFELYAFNQLNGSKEASSSTCLTERKCSLVPLCLAMNDSLSAQRYTAMNVCCFYNHLLRPCLVSC